MAVSYDEFGAIAAIRPPRQRAELLALAEEYRRRREREVLELAAISADVGIDDFTNLGLEPDFNPQLLEAFRRQLPNIDPASLPEKSVEQLENYVNQVKGKYFEVLARDRLNAGESVGELQLEPGQVARLADSPNQAGWDLQIVDGNGETVEQIQLKATESISYVKEALEKYPHIRVAVPEEIDSEPANIIGTGISQSILEENTEEYIEELSEDAIRNALDIAAEFAVDVVPVTSALIIGVTEGRRYLMGRATLRDTMRSGGKRLGRVSVYSAVGSALSSTGLGMAAIPVVLGLRVTETRLTSRMNLGDNLQSRTAELDRL